MYEEMFSLTDSIDYIVVGEGEETIAELTDAIAAGREPSDVLGLAYRKGGRTVFTGRRPLIEDLDPLEKAWDLLDWEDYTYFIMPGSRLGAVDNSRGCDQDCTFCSQQKYWGQSWRAKSPEGVVADIREQKEKYEVDVVLFTDEYSSPNRERWERLLDLLIEADLGVSLLIETRAGDIVRDRDIIWKYKKAGIVHIYVGIEATEQVSLEYMKKDLNVEESRLALDLLREHDIISETSMILGLPDDTPESIQRTIDAVKEYNPDFAHFLAIAPWPYSDIYKELEPYIEDRDYTKYNLIDPVVKPKAMTREDVDRAIINGYREFYMNKFIEMNAMKRMMSNSFIKKKLGMLGEMPEEIRAIIESEMA
jgi:anaerobic magnesium-protoporphyrin IX monomethyl ester cyclase